MDTVRLKFPYPLTESFFFRDRIHSKELNLETASGSRFIYTNNGWREERKARGIYTPKYWIEEGFFDSRVTYFAIEFSALKMIFQEGISQPKTSDFPKLMESLKSFLEETDVRIFDQQIRNTIPIVIAVGRNIDLTDLCPCDLAIQALLPFDDRFRSKQRIIVFDDCDYGGKEIYFGNKSTSLKLYNEMKETANNAVTAEEKKIAVLLDRKNSYGRNSIWVKEALRVELTLRKKQTIIQKAKNYLGKEPAFENLFNEDFWFAVLKDEINEIYNHPLKNFIFLAMQNKPVIDAFLQI